MRFKTNMLSLLLVLSCLFRVHLNNVYDSVACILPDTLLLHLLLSSPTLRCHNHLKLSSLLWHQPPWLHYVGYHPIYCWLLYYKRAVIWPLPSNISRPLCHSGMRPRFCKVPDLSLMLQLHWPRTPIGFIGHEGSVGLSVCKVHISTTR
jgi:hypothetical protein